MYGEDLNAKYRADYEAGIHDHNNPYVWEKQNLVTKKDREGLYDLYKCRICGMKFKRRGLSWHPPAVKEKNS
jgi:hypothetical protein